MQKCTIALHLRVGRRFPVKSFLIYSYMHSQAHSYERYLALFYNMCTYTLCCILIVFWRGKCVEAIAEILMYEAIGLAPPGKGRTERNEMEPFVDAIGALQYVPPRPFCTCTVTHSARDCGPPGPWQPKKVAWLLQAPSALSS